MTFASAVTQDVFAYFDHIFSNKQGAAIVKFALEENTREVAKDFYEFYVKDKKLKSDLENKEFEQLAKRFNVALIQAAPILRNTFIGDHDVAEYSPWTETLTSIVRYVDVGNKQPLSYRLYLNLKTEHFASFLETFLLNIFTKSILCPHCAGEAKYKQNEQKIVCTKCVHTNFFFVIKLHQPIVEKGENLTKEEQDKLMTESVVLRRDKLIIGFADKKVLKSVAYLIKKMGRIYFSEKTPYLSHEIFPGAGVSLEPNSQETEDYRRATQETEEIITFEHILTNIIADVFVRLVKQEKEIVQGVMAEWVVEHKHHLFQKLQSKVVNPLEQLLETDQRLERLFIEMETIKAEMTSIEG